MNIVKEALFESRPYVEYWEKLQKLVGELWKESTDFNNFVELLKEEIDTSEEPFKTDLRIFLQKLESLKG
ncbi:hypothetical protein [Thermococcus sp.]